MSSVIGIYVAHNVRKIMFLVNDVIRIYEKNFLCKISLYLVIYIANNVCLL